MGVGSDSDQSTPYIDVTWTFIDPYPTGSHITAFLTPRADATYMDTFAPSLQSSTNINLTLTVGRVDGQQPQPQPWGQSPSISFLPVDLTAPPPGFTAGTTMVGSSLTRSYQIVSVTFGKPYGSVPRILVTPHGSENNRDLFVATVVSVTQNVREAVGKWHCY